jgi:DNA-binding GntR family transcriptional regulator
LIADAMGVSAPAATSMAKRLAGLGLVEHRKHRGVTLTPPGEKVALEVVRHHRLLEVYLTQTLGLSRDKVHFEAERLEHVALRARDHRVRRGDRRGVRGRDLHVQSRPERRPARRRHLGHRGRTRHPRPAARGSSR